MKRNKILLMATIAAMSLVSCSDDLTEGVDNGLDNSFASQSKVNVVNDPTQLSQYVTNYKIGAVTRAMPAIPAQGYETEAMPTLPSSVDGMTKVEAPSWKWGGLDGNTNFYVAAGDVQDFTGGGLNANNQCNLYVFGKLVVPSFSPAQGANIYIAPGGELVVNGTDWAGNVNGVLTNDTYTNLYIYNGGKYTGSYTTASKTGLYVEGDVNVGTAELGGKVVVGGKLTADALTTNNSKFKAASVEAASWTYNNDSEVNVEELIQVNGNVTINAQNVSIKCKNYSVKGDFHMENNSVLYAYEHLGVNGNFEVSTQGVVYTPCLYVRDNLYIKNCATLAIPNFIYCGNFEASASGFNIQMGENALIQSDKDFTIQNKDWKIEFNNTAATEGAIVAKGKFEIMEGEAAYIYGYAVLSATEYWGKPSENTKYYVEGDDYKNYNLQETVQVTFDGVTVNNSKDDCTPDFTAAAPPAPAPKITELISSIKHTHDISATCISIANGKGYLSWHKRGTSIHGCLEALQVVNDQTQLTSWMEVDDDDVEGGDNWGGNSAVGGTDETQGQFDYNHIIVANGKVVTVGDHAKMSGFIGAIELDENGDFGTNGTLQSFFKYRQLLGSVDASMGRSGNAVLYDGNKYYIACAAGFQEYTGNLDDLFVKEDNKWKAKLGAYQLTNGSAKHIAINPAKTLVATLELISKGTHADGDDYWFNDTETKIGAILKVRNANDWLNSTVWSVDIDNIAPIYGKNAIAMDANGNVYVSAGRKGLLVYNNGAKVGEFRLGASDPEAGANGVAIDDKYVYVAYGVGGLYILDKNDLSVVSWYKSNAPEGYSTEAAAASANYVALDGTYIYVAYGRHGVKVLKLND